MTNPGIRVLSSCPRPKPRALLILLFEVAVLEDVGCGADEAKANVVVTTVAERELSSLEHDDFVSLSVLAPVHDFIDPGFANGIARRVFRSMAGGAVTVIGFRRSVV